MKKRRGAIAPNSIVTVGFLTYFLSDDGFWITNGVEAQPLGQKVVNEYFLAEASDADLFRTVGAVDWLNQSVIWAYVSKDGSGFNRQIIWNWSEKRWSTASLALNWLASGGKDATNLEDLDAVYPAGLDSIPIPLDSDLFEARERALMAFQGDANGIPYDVGVTYDAGVTYQTAVQIGALDGETLQADFETGEYQSMPSRREFVSEVYPIVENASENTQAAVITKSNPGGPEAVSEYGALNAAGFCPVRSDGRYSRIAVRVPQGAEWDKAAGIQVTSRPSGSR